MVHAKRTPLAFGSNVKRFDKITSHPGLDPSGLFATRSPGCDPCLYHPQPISKAYENMRKQKVDKEPWRYKAELEEWSKNLGYRNQEVLDRRQWFSVLLGPAWTDLDLMSAKLSKYEPACKNVQFGRTSRFKQPKNLIPGPGTYFRGEPFKAPYGPHSIRPTFEREEPCRFPDSASKWSLAPNRYIITDKESIENKAKKIVSLRGPYSLFTGKRDGSTIKNHFSTSQKIAAATWPIALPGSLEGYKKKKFGTWNKTSRDIPPRDRTANTDLAMTPRKPSDPAPTSYEVCKPREVTEYKYGFNSSYDRPPGYQRVVVWPGVGRYNTAKDPICGIAGQGHRHVFTSKIGRTIGAVIQEPMNSF